MIIHRLLGKSDIHCVRISADRNGLYYKTTEKSEYIKIPLSHIDYIES